MVFNKLSTNLLLVKLIKSIIPVLADQDMLKIFSELALTEFKSEMMYPLEMKELLFGTIKMVYSTLLLNKQMVMN